MNIINNSASDPWSEDVLLASQQQLNRAWALAHAHGHEWALGDFPQSVMMLEGPNGHRVSVREALKDNADQVEIWSAIRTAGESALPTIGELRTASVAMRGMSLPGISAPRTKTVAGVTVIVHTTGTGRLSWEVWPNGRVDIAITRPSPIGLPIGVEVLHLTVEDVVAGDADRDGRPSRSYPVISRVEYATSSRPWEGCQARHLAVATRCLEALGFSAYQIAVKLAPAIVAGANAADAAPESEEYVGNFLAGLRGQEVAWQGRPAKLYATPEMAERLMTDTATVAAEGGVVVTADSWSAALEMDKSLYPGQFLAGVVIYYKTVVPAEWRRDNANEVFDGDFGGRQATVYTQWGYRDALMAKRPQLRPHQVVIELAPGQSGEEPVYISGDDYVVAVVKYEE